MELSHILPKVAGNIRTVIQALVAIAVWMGVAGYCGGRRVVYYRGGNLSRRGTVESGVGV